MKYINKNSISSCLCRSVRCYVLHTEWYSMSRWATAWLVSSEMTKFTVPLKKGQKNLSSQETNICFPLEFSQNGRVSQTLVMAWLPLSLSELLPLFTRLIHSNWFGFFAIFHLTLHSPGLFALLQNGHNNQIRQKSQIVMMTATAMTEIFECAKC